LSEGVRERERERERESEGVRERDEGKGARRGSKSGTRRVTCATARVLLHVCCETCATARVLLSCETCATVLRVV